ncbi:MAG: ATP synthase F0 subunit B [Thermodesulfobacteriota bacterium]
MEVLLGYFNLTLIFQLVIFLILMFLLTRLLFRPILRVIQRREELISGGKGQAESFSAQAKELMERYQAGLAEAKKRALEEWERLRAEGLATEAQTIKGANEEGQRMLAEVKQALQVESGKAREYLRQQTELISSEIAVKLLGRQVH